MANKSLKELLSEIGASYFVSYLYWKYINKSHKNYIKRKTSKIGLIEKLRDDYSELLKIVLDMEERNLDRNDIGLSGKEIIRMAKELNNLFNNNTVFTIHIKPNNLISFNTFSQIINDINDCIKEFETGIGEYNLDEKSYICEFKKGSLKLDVLAEIIKTKINDFLKHFISYFSRSNSNVEIHLGNESKKTSKTKKNCNNKVDIENITIENPIINIIINDK